MKFVRSASLCVAPAAVAWLLPAAAGALLYDRNAILHGEWWRMWTGHWVHFSASHLAWNAAIFLGAGAWLEHLQPNSLLRFVVVAAPLLSVSLLAGAPDMQAYGGLSGLATGVVVLLALMQRDRHPRSRAWWGGVLALVVLKLGVEAVRPAPLFAGLGSEVRPSLLAHVAGVALATAFFLSRRFGHGSFLGRRHAAGAFTQ